jgi:hypothetical protein
MKINLVEKYPTLCAAITVAPVWAISMGVAWLLWLWSGYKESELLILPLTIVTLVSTAAFAILRDAGREQQLEAQRNRESNLEEARL